MPTDILGKLLDPYRRAVEGRASTMGALEADPVYGTLGMFDAPTGGGGFILGGVPQGSGILELLYGPNVPGHEGHLHLAMERGLVPLGRKLQRMGFDVGEHPAFGGVDPVHTEGSHHYDRDAIDVNYYGDGRWKNEANALQWLEDWLSQNYG